MSRLHARRRWRDLLRAEDGLAITELALTMPVMLLMVLGSTEIANYMTVRMRVSQLALHIADHAARIGEGSQLQAKKISEAQILDLLEGANLQGSGLDLEEQGRVVVSSLEPVADPNPTDRYKIAWQRCYGKEQHTQLYGRQGDTNLAGMGPASNQVIAMDGGATMFVELNYRYKPLIPIKDNVEFGEFTEIATMAVRDRRDTTQVYNEERVTPANCAATPS